MEQEKREIEMRLFQEANEKMVKERMAREEADRLKYEMELKKKKEEEDRLRMEEYNRGV